jgi:hypothetical protein
MNDALDTIRDLKLAHANTILSKLDELKALIASEPDLWFGGLPPSFEELLRIADHRANAIRQTFEITA